MLSDVSKSVTDSEFALLLRNVNFRRLFAGRVITDTGDSLYYIASMWLVWELTGSPFYTGLAGALLQLPNALSFLTGPLVDKWNLRSVLLGTQCINLLGVLVIPIVATLGHLSVWWILVLMPVLDFVNGFVYPAQNAALPRIVDRDRLTRANSLFSTSIRTVDMVANAIAGILIQAIGAISLFVVNAGTFAIAAVVFLGVSVSQSDEEQSNESDDIDEDDSYMTTLKQGLGYVRGSSFSSMLVGMMIGNFTAVAAGAVLPAFADQLGGPVAYGVLVAAMGGGNLVGAAGAFLVEDYPLGGVAVVGNVLSGGLWITALIVPGVWATASLLFAAVIPTGAFNVLFGSMYQGAVDDALLGRVSSLVRTLSSAMMPLGALLGGTVATSVGSTTVMYIAGGASILLAVYYLVHPKLRSLPATTEIDETALGL